LLIDKSLNTHCLDSIDVSRFSPKRHPVEQMNYLLIIITAWSAIAGGDKTQI
jgi:hypothetical protein